MSRRQRQIGLIGLGPHAQRIYYPLIEQEVAASGLRLGLLVELDDKIDEVHSFLARRTVQPERILFLPARFRSGLELSAHFETVARQAIAAGLSGVIIATEPKSHLVYARWAIANGMHVLIDKPLTAVDLNSADPAAALQIVDHYFELAAASRLSDACFLIQTQRRAHPGYLAMREYLREFIAKYEVPITYLDIHHADGMWNMPYELAIRENHPYKYGYGKLMHSGYHFLDLFAWLIELNDLLSHASADRIEVDVRHTRPYDHLAQIRPETYMRLFGADAHAAVELGPYEIADLRRFGELDVFAMLQCLRGDAVITTGILSLLQTSFSRRAWPQLPADTYKANGRVRHERVTVQVGHFLNVQVHSYQAHEAKDREILGSGPGSYDHFDLSFYRNSQLVGGPPVEHIAVGETLRRKHVGESNYLGNNELARAGVFADFMRADPSRAALDRHELAVKLLAACYFAILSRNTGRRLSPRVSLRPGERVWFETVESAAS